MWLCPSRVTVRTPPYARLTTLVTVVNGHIVDTRTVDPALSDIVNLDQVIEITITRDSYVHVLAWGPERMSQVYAGALPFSITNPIFLDVDGDADNNGDAFESPGVDELLDDVNYAICTL